MTMEFKSQSYMLIVTWSEMTGAERMEGRNEFIPQTAYRVRQNLQWRKRNQVRFLKFRPLSYFLFYFLKIILFFIS